MDGEDSRGGGGEAGDRSDAGVDGREEAVGGDRGEQDMLDFGEAAETNRDVV